MTTANTLSTGVNIYFSPILCSEFNWLVWCIVLGIFYFVIFQSLYRYINLRWSTICCSFWKYVFFFCYFSIQSNIFCFICNCSFVTELFLDEFLNTFVIISEILLPIKSPVASAVFWIALFKAVLNVSVKCCLAWSRIFWLCLRSTFLLNLYFILLIFLASSSASFRRSWVEPPNQNAQSFFKHLIFRFNWV